MRAWLIVLFTLVCSASAFADNQSEALGLHNHLRSLHHAPNLAWDDTLAAYAANYARHCEFKHSHGPYGENLAAGYPTVTAAIKAWYAEGDDYKYQGSSFGSHTGHFTQIVWVGSKRLGCAFVACDGRNGTPGKYLVCEYSPPGNVTNPGYFNDNVLPVSYR
jgi:hypothetical protein